MFETAVGTHLKVLSGFAFPSTGFTTEGGIPLVRIRDIMSEKTEVNYIGSYPDDYLIENGDLLVGMDGDFNVVRWKGNEALLNQRVCKISSNSPSIHQGFLFWYLIPQIEKIHRVTPQTTVKHLSTKRLYEIPFPSFSFSEQEYIANILDTLDTQIRQTEAIIAKLQQVKQGLLHDLLTRGIDANGQLRPPRDQAPELYKESPLGWIPKEWELYELQHLSSRIVDGTHFTPTYTDSGVPFLRVTDVQSRTIDPMKTKYISKAEHKLLTTRCAPQKGDILLSKNGTVGIAKLVDWDWEFSIFVSLAMIQLSDTDKTNPGYVTSVLNSNVLKLQIQKRSKQGTVINLHLEEIREFLIPVPDRDEQDRITATIQTFEDKLFAEEETLAKLKKQKSGLMDDLLTGRVRVTALLENAQASEQES